MTPVTAHLRLKAASITTVTKTALNEPTNSYVTKYRRQIIVWHNPKCPQGVISIGAVIPRATSIPLVKRNRDSNWKPSLDRPRYIKSVRTWKPKQAD
jgi:hypothetical protein